MSTASALAPSPFAFKIFPFAEAKPRRKAGLFLVPRIEAVNPRHFPPAVRAANAPSLLPRRGFRTGSLLFACLASAGHALDFPRSRSRLSASRSAAFRSRNSPASTATIPILPIHLSRRQISASASAAPMLACSGSIRQLPKKSQRGVHRNKGT